MTDRAFASSDPIRLQGLDTFGPVNFIEAQKFIGIFRGFEEPLLQSLFDDGRAASFADAVFADHLLTRQRGIVLRAPVHCGHLAICQPRLVQLDEEPFRPFVIGRVG